MDYAIKNKFGHFKHEPRFFVAPSDHKPRPYIIDQAIEWLKDAYNAPRKFMEFLGFNNGKRIVRSERREAIASVSQVMLHYLNIETFEVGVPRKDGSMKFFDLKWISEKAGLTTSVDKNGVEQYPRAKRAMSDLIRKGYLKVTRQHSKDEFGEMFRLPSRRFLSTKFLVDLGIDMKKIVDFKSWKRKKSSGDTSITNKVASSLEGLFNIHHNKRVQINNNNVTTCAKPKAPQEVINRYIPQAMENHRLDNSKSISEHLKVLLSKYGYD